MKIEFHKAKSAKNADERGLPFELTADLNWSAARIRRDDRRDYGEQRFVALVPKAKRLYVVCYCVRGDARRIISFRKANRREERRMKRPPMKKALTDKSGEVRELTKDDMRLFRPVADVDPGMIEDIAQFRRTVGRPKALAPKVLIGFRLSADVVASIKASGRGYNVRIERILREAGFGGDGREQASKKAAAKKAAAAGKRRAEGAGVEMSKRRE